MVEDESPIALELVSVIEEEAGCAVAGVASSVDEALSLIALERPNGAVLDANLNGSTSVKIVGALPPQNTPFFVLSGDSARALPSASVDEASFLQKPYGQSELYQTIRSLLALTRENNH